jgi:hypothetical protein
MCADHMDSIINDNIAVRRAISHVVALDPSVQNPQLTRKLVFDFVRRFIVKGI